MSALRDTLDEWRAAAAQRYGGAWSARVILYDSGPFVRLSWDRSPRRSEVPLDARGLAHPDQLDAAAAYVVGEELRADIAQGEAMAYFIRSLEAAG